MRSVFGWSLPPGVTQSMIDGGIEGPCQICGLNIDDCICPECPQCSAQGDPFCYESHGLKRSSEQIASKKAFDDEEAAYYNNSDDTTENPLPKP